MVIKRKDGSIYKLQGPNPMMANQSFWDEETIIHNFDKIPETVTSQGKDITTNYEEIPLQDIEPDEVYVPAKEIDPTNLPNPTRKKPPREVPLITVHVLPSAINESYDPLYDETRTSITFGTKFTMQAVIANRNDIGLTLWTNSTEVAKGSIVYLPEDRRWWRIQEVASRADGWMMHCTPSDLQPSF